MSDMRELKSSYTIFCRLNNQDSPQPNIMNIKNIGWLKSGTETARDTNRIKSCCQSVWMYGNKTISTQITKPVTFNCVIAISKAIRYTVVLSHLLSVYLLSASHC